MFDAGADFYRHTIVRNRERAHTIDVSVRSIEPSPLRCSPTVRRNPFIQNNVPPLHTTGVVSSRAFLTAEPFRPTRYRTVWGAPSVRSRRCRCTSLSANSSTRTISEHDLTVPERHSLYPSEPHPLRSTRAPSTTYHQHAAHHVAAGLIVSRTRRREQDRRMRLSQDSYPRRKRLLSLHTAVRQNGSVTRSISV